MDILYGVHSVEEALRAGRRHFDHVVVARERQDGRLEKLILKRVIGDFFTLDAEADEDA